LITTSDTYLSEIWIKGRDLQIWRTGPTTVFVSFTLESRYNLQDVVVSVGLSTPSWMQPEGPVNDQFFSGRLEPRVYNIKMFLTVPYDTGVFDIGWIKSTMTVRYPFSSYLHYVHLEDRIPGKWTGQIKGVADLEAVLEKPDVESVRTNGDVSAVTNGGPNIPPRIPNTR
jgi:hypothetical protein